MDVEQIEGIGTNSGNNVASGSTGNLDQKQNVCVSASATRMETIRFLHRWTIEQFSVQLELSSVGESLTSNPFGSDDGRYKFLLKLFPGGKDEECRGYLSLFLQIQKCPNPKLRFRVNFYIDTTDGPRGCALNRNVVTINKGGIVTASKFFSSDTLKGRGARFMPDDTLTVGVELTVFGEQYSKDIPVGDGEGSSAEMSSEKAPIAGTLSYDLGQLLLDKTHTDCILHVQSRPFHVHKAILSARSPVFAAMFGHSENQEAQTSEATLEDVTPEAVETLLEFVYKDSSSLIAVRSAEVLAAADKYCIERLKTQCEMALCADLALGNICERLRLSDAYSAKTLRRRALAFFRKHKTEILASEEWTELERECPTLAASVLKDLVVVSDDASARLSLGEPPAKRPRT